MILACSADPGLTALFTPPRPHLGRYEACTSAASPDEIVRATDRVDGEPIHFSDPEALEALEAFGGAAPYDRAALAQLYGGRRVRVVRGWTRRDDAFESVTLLSPYPDASLRTLNEGTLIIRFVLPPSL